MYFPYFRGKQYELITLREMAEDISNSGMITPILEPVKENLSSLIKCITELNKSKIPFVFVINPKHGDFKNNNKILTDQIVDGILQDNTKFQVGYIINNNSELSDISSSLLEFGNHRLSLIHYGYPDGEALAEELKNKNINIETNIYIDGFCGRRYRKHFESLDGKSVLVRDGFRKLKNADYPEDESFSELHLTYEDEGVSDFGDFLTVGDDYSESGGPAYAVAIHLTYLREDKEINIKHFISDRTNSPVDPAGKFLEALEKLDQEVNSENSLVFKSSSVKEFQQLYQRTHFPGLGYVKKLSMKHHLELMMYFLKR